MLLHHFTLMESMSGLINEGREDDILVFWPEIELKVPRTHARQ